MLGFVDGLRELEQANAWYEACDLLYRRWSVDKMDADKLIRVALECWYVLLEGSVIGFSEDEREASRIGEMLSECSAYGLEKLSSTFDFVWAYVYMTAVSSIPLTWNDGSEAAYAAWEDIGRQLNCRGLALYPDYPLAGVTFIGPDYDAHQRAKKLAEIDVEQLFPNDDEMSLYFRAMYTPMR